VLDRFAAAGLLVGIWELTSDVGLPVFLCHLTTRAPDPARPLPVGAGQGCHTRREIALLRALTEAAQSRLTVIAGTRDDLFVDDYASLTESTALAAHRAFLAQQPAERPFTAAPTYDFPTFTADLQFVCDRLQAAGIREIIRVDLTQPEIGVPVVRVIVPGLEWEDEPPGSIQLGERARARRGEQ
jgi:ribosomal protein S12 methylthiotransferase accessory factor